MREVDTLGQKRKNHVSLIRCRPSFIKCWRLTDVGSGVGFGLGFDEGVGEGFVLGFGLGCGLGSCVGLNEERPHAVPKPAPE